MENCFLQVDAIGIVLCEQNDEPLAPGALSRLLIMTWDSSFNFLFDLKLPDVGSSVHKT